MQRNVREGGLDPDVMSRVAALPEAGQRWLKMALAAIADFDEGASAERPAPEREPEPKAKRRPRIVEREEREEAEEADEAPMRAPADLEAVISGKAKLEDQLEAYPELADELEGLADVIDLLREAGQKRRRRGEEVLRELGLVPPEGEEPEAGGEELEPEE